MDDEWNNIISEETTHPWLYAAGSSPSILLLCLQHKYVVKNTWNRFRVFAKVNYRLQTNHLDRSGQVKRYLCLNSLWENSPGGEDPGRKWLFHSCRNIKSLVSSLGWNQRLSYNLIHCVIVTLLQWVLHGAQCYLCFHIKAWLCISLCRLLWSEPCEDDPKRHAILVSSQIEIKTLFTFT